jgi:protein SCO1/2
MTVLPSFYTKGISRTVLKKEIDLTLILEDKEAIELVFFGYAGCVNICTPRLESIAKWYKRLANKEKILVRFVDISVPQDKTLPQSFAQVFDESFKGVYLSENDVRVYSRPFEVYFSKSLFDKTEFDHSANLYLLKREGDKKYIRYIYTAYPFDFKQIESDLQELIDE